MHIYSFMHPQFHARELKFDTLVIWNTMIPSISKSGLQTPVRIIKGTPYLQQRHLMQRFSNSNFYLESLENNENNKLSPISPPKQKSTQKHLGG